METGSAAVGGSPAPPRGAYAAWVVVCIVWGTGFAAYRVAAESSAPPLLFAGLRLLFAGLILLAVARLLGHRFPPWGQTHQLCLGGILIEGTVNAAIAWASGTSASALLAFATAAIPVWAAAIEDEPGGGSRSIRSPSGLLCGGIGAALLIGPTWQGSSAMGGIHGGVALVCVATLGAAWAYHRTKALASAVSLPVTSGLQLSAAGAVVSLAGLLAGEGPRFAFTPASLGAFAYLLVFGSLIAYSCLVYSLRWLPAPFVATHRFANPLVALLLGWLLFGERLATHQWAGAALILSSLAIVIRAQAATTTENKADSNRE